jgi:hypothetical protein
VRVPDDALVSVPDELAAICAWLIQWVMAGGVSPSESRETTFHDPSPVEKAVAA